MNWRRPWRILRLAAFNEQRLEPVGIADAITGLDMVLSMTTGRRLNAAAARLDGRLRLRLFAHPGNSMTWY